jgi:hypothetical protein
MPMHSNSPRWLLGRGNDCVEFLDYADSAVDNVAVSERKSDEFGDS